MVRLKVVTVVSRVEKLILKFIRYLNVFKNVLKETHCFSC